MGPPQPQLSRLAKNLAVVGLSLTAVGCGSSESEVATRPDARKAIPTQLQGEIHGRIHRLRRVCRHERAVARAARAFLGYYRRYPPGRYRWQVHDETATTFSALLVARDRLRRCDADWTRRIDAVLPPRVRTALRPPVDR